MGEYLVRFIAGGAVVSVFALIGDVLRPKSFAGLFGAAPSIALVSLSLAGFAHGPEYVTTEAKFMMAGATALTVFSLAMVHLLMKSKFSVGAAALTCVSIWLAVSFGLFGVFLA